MTWQTKSTSSEHTEQLGGQLAKTLRGGEVIELISDLGGGKTTFVRGMVRGLNSHDKVTSPTFTICKIYQAGNLEIHHFDFYRLQEPGIVADELAEVVGEPNVVVVVEWANAVSLGLPADKLTITMQQVTDGSRALTFRCPEELSYLMKNMA